MYLNIIRQVILPLALAYALSRINLAMVWTAFIAAELLAIPVSRFLMRRLEKLLT